MKVYTGGTFDLFHAGHVEFLARCAAMGEVWVSLNTDEFVESYKGARPVTPFDERAYILTGCRYVSGVVTNMGGADSKPAIEFVAPDLIVIGSDWFYKDYMAQMQLTWEFLHNNDIALVFVPRITPVSTTGVKERLYEDRSRSAGSPAEISRFEAVLRDVATASGGVFSGSGNDGPTSNPTGRPEDPLYDNEDTLF